MGFLIPELISLTGMSDQQRANYNTMALIAPFTKLSPKQRVGKTNDLVETLNRNGRLRIGAARRIVAFQLFQPNVKLFNTTLKNHGDGNMVVKQKLKVPVAFKDYLIVYSCGNNPKIDDNEADALLDNLKKASEAFGVNFSKPGFIACESKVNSWMT